MSQSGETIDQSDGTEPTTIVLTQRVGASPDVVFDFLTDPQKMLRWMGTEVDIDPKPGGKFWLNATGTDIAVGSYLEVDRPNRLVFTWGWDGSEEVPPASSTVTITLTVEDGETVVELEHSGLPAGQDTEHTRGWTYYLARLGAVSEGRDPDSSPA